MHGKDRMVALGSYVLKPSDSLIPPPASPRKMISILWVKAALGTVADPRYQPGLSLLRRLRDQHFYGQ